ncbi:hypothetical protein ACLBWP_17625 [Microbacterium sp. M1A1_1b]|uniref:hypothetical protein n=1 Tax=Curtobacterium sp. VKM Ac-2922 TaxID=2929475 RepID=UPI001FB3D3B3|nr:hypothetical protein [Curtobacterium sp. VKM Ac-2922]MCJ1715942.1 hypothetical protein [Curtobacterium sp. VKM Ac-2922]
MTVDTRAVSRTVTEAVLAVPSVLSVIPPGPSLAVLVRDVRSVLDLPRGGGAVLVEDRAEGVRVRVVAAVAASTSAIESARAVRDAVVTTVEHHIGTRPSSVVVRIVEIV